MKILSAPFSCPFHPEMVPQVLSYDLNWYFKKYANVPQTLYL